MNQLEFFKENYYLEFEVKERIDRTAYNTVTILAILGGIIYFFYNKIIPINNNSPIEVIAPFIVSIISFLVAIFFIIKAIYNHIYMYMPTTELLKTYYDDLLRYYSNEDVPDILAQDDFEEYIMTQYVKDASINYLNNARKSGFVHRANLSIVITLVSIIITASAYFITNANKVDYQKIEIVNIDKLNQTRGEIMSKEPTKPTTPAPKPTPPPSIPRRDGNVPQKPPTPKK